MNLDSCATDYAAVFAQSPHLQLLLDPGLMILAVTQSYAKATMIDPRAVVGRHLFEVFPDNPDYSHADGVVTLRGSLFTAMKTKAPHHMAIQRYDIRQPAEQGGGFEIRYWRPCNWPIIGSDGYVVLLVHQVEDVTETVSKATERPAI